LLPFFPFEFRKQLEWTGIGKSFFEEERKALSRAKLPTKLRTDSQISQERAFSGASTKFSRSYRWAFSGAEAQLSAKLLKHYMKLTLNSQRS